MNDFTLYIYICYITVATSSCPSGFTHYSGRCYWRPVTDTPATRKNWTDASADCVNRGGFLAGIYTSSIQATIQSSGLLWTQTYVGLLRVNNVWKWRDGSSVVYSNWDSLDNSQTPGLDCVRMKNTGEWLAGACQQSRVYLCEAHMLTLSQPSVLPSSAPSPVPSSLSPTYTPSCAPSLWPSGVPSFRPSEPPRCMPSPLPSLTPSAVPSSSTPMTYPSSVPTALPSTLPTEAPSSSGPTSSMPNSLPSDVPQSEPSVLPSSAPSVRPSVFSHVPSSAPTTLLPISVPTSMPSLLPTRLEPVFVINVELSRNVIYGGVTLGDALSIRWEDRPPVLGDIVVDLWCEFSALVGGESFFIRPFVPNTLTIQAGAGETWLFSASVPANLPYGTYRLDFNISGGNDDAVDIVYSPGSDTFKVLNAVSGLLLPPPMISSARYASDGSRIEVTFDAPTDVGRLSSTFSCSKLLHFDGSEVASCLWRGNAVLLVHCAGAHETIDEISLLPEVLRAGCLTTNMTQCLLYSTSPAQLVEVSSPLIPDTPHVFVNAPSVIGPCTAFILDLTASTGHMYTRWTSLGFISVTLDGKPDADLNTFFSREYQFQPPTSLPANRLQVLGSYKFTIQLCNIYGVCSSVYTHKLSVSTATLPVVTVPGARNRILQRSDSLKLYSSSFVEDCDGVKSSSGLTYAWVVMQNGSIVDMGVPLSRPTLAVPGGKLRVGYVYSVTLHVTDESTGAVAISAPVTASVRAGSVKAVVSGASTRTIRVGDTAIIDASRSYDMDQPGVLAGNDDGSLSFEWTCSTIKPFDANACPFQFPSARTPTIVIAPVNASLVYTVARVSVIVRASQRFNTADVQITILPALSPDILILASDMQIRRASKLKIRSRIVLEKPAMAIWSVNGGIDIADVALSNTKTHLSAGQHWFSLVVKANSLPPSSLLIFTLSCGLTTASLQVQVVGAPVPGVFSVSPASGLELTDTFVFATSHWKADNLPITFIFGVLDDDDTLTVLQLRSEFNSATSPLSRGYAADGFNVTCVVRAFSAMDAHEDLRAIVRVLPQTLSPMEFDQLLQGRLEFASSQASSGNHLMQVIGTGVRSMNSANCSFAPNCSVLHRQKCGDVAHTCGECLSGYIGESGHSNTACFLEGPLMGDISKVCVTDSDCDGHQFCDPSTSICLRQEKSCVEGCDLHGTCQHRMRSSHALTEFCGVGDSSCYARCICDDGYGGIACAIPYVDVQRKILTRRRMIEALRKTVEHFDVAVDDYGGLLKLLVAIGRYPLELDSYCCKVLINTVHMMLDIGSHMSMPYEEFVHASTLISVCMEVYVDTSRSGNNVAELQSAEEIQTRLSLLVAADMILGQQPVDIIEDFYRMSVNLLPPQPNASAVLSAPSSPSELAFRRRPSQIYITFKEESVNGSTVIVTERPSRQLDNNTNVISNLIKMDMPDITLIDDIVSFVIRFERDVDFAVDPSVNQTFHTSCNGTTAWQDHFTCANGFVITHRCDSRQENLESACPWSHWQPTCALVVDGSLDAASGACKVANHTPSMMTCACSLRAVQTRVNRRLGVLEQSGYIEGCALSEHLYEEFRGTLTRSDELTLQDFRKSMMVLVLYIILWGFVLCVVFSVSVTSMRPAEPIARGGVLYSQRFTRNRTSLDRWAEGIDIRAYLIKYIDSIIPAVFRPRQSYSKSLVEEFFKHHR